VPHDSYRQIEQLAEQQRYGDNVASIGTWLISIAIRELENEGIIPRSYMTRSVTEHPDEPIGQGSYERWPTNGDALKGEAVPEVTLREILDRLDALEKLIRKDTE